MKPIILHVLAFAALLCSWTAAAGPKPNVLFIMSDDLRDTAGCYGHPSVKTPNLDRLAARGVRFDRAFAQYPVCNPSRTSLLTGLRCEQTGIVGNAAFFRDSLPDIVTLPQLLRQGGWTTHSFGKIYHTANTGEGQRVDWLDAGKSWDKAEAIAPLAAGRGGDVRNLTGVKLPWCEVGAMDGPEENQPDAQTATAAIRSLEELSAGGKPWMIAAGFHRPHDPFHSPRKYFDLYPKDQLALYRDPADMTAASPMAIASNWKKTFDEFSDDDRRSFLQAYLAGVSFMDAQVGRLLDALDRLKLAENSIIIFLGDHGYHLGERGWWNKNTLFDRSCRAPLLIAAPGMKGGQVCRGPVEFVDIYPTIAELCGQKPPPALAGKSLRPVLEDAACGHKEAAFTLVTRGRENFGQSVRTARWRFTRWSDGTLELYDHDAEPLLPVNWADPIQLTHGQLADALFEGPLADAVQAADPKLLSPAIQVVSRNADGMARAKLRSFFDNRLKLEDVVALAPDILAAVKTPSPAVTMFSNEIRMGGFKALTKYHFKVGIEAGVEFAKTQGGHGSESRTGEIMKEIVKYGIAARGAIPGLRELIVSLNEQCARGEYPKGELNDRRVGAVEDAIKAIEAATTQPEIRSTPAVPNKGGPKQ